jgi:hypothetical protein
MHQKQQGESNMANRKERKKSPEKKKKTDFFYTNETSQDQ